MCGIAASVEFKPDAGSEGRIRAGLERAVAVMKERGPDGQGVETGPSWGAAHVRLAIMDVAGGAQPWRREGSPCILVYNGEIFNYLQINEELKKLGHSFRTHCDTETVLEAYLEWGEECVKRFNGFFAFAVIDPEKKRLFAARDRLGVKPLHWRKDEKGFCLASSVAAALACSGVKMEPDLEALSHFLTTGRVVFGEKTMAKGVMSLQPGRKLGLDLESGALSVSRYWTRPALSPSEKASIAPSFSEAVDMAGALIDDAVKIRLMSDVPLGAFLSGGLDSSIIALCAKRHSSAPELPLFCAGSDDESMNEYVYAEEMASSIGLPVERVQVGSEGFMRDWGMLCEKKGLPLSTPNEVSIHHLSKALGRRCKVALTGEGADEIFGGYIQPQYSAVDFERSLSGKAGDFEDSPVGSALSMMFGRCRFLNDTDHFLSTACWLPYLEKASLFEADAWAALEEDSPVFAFYEDFFDRYEKCSVFDRRMHLFAEFNLESLLHRIDNASMCASIEARVPFTDYRLAELAFALPDSYKMDFRDPQAAAQGKDLPSVEIDRLDLLESKRLPRNAFKRFLPKNVTDRKKKSFPVPVANWLRGDLYKEVVGFCMDSPLARGVFKRDELEKRLYRGGDAIWAIANACKWASSMTR